MGALSTPESVRCDSRNVCAPKPGTGTTPPTRLPSPSKGNMTSVPGSPAAAGTCARTAPPLTPPSTVSKTCGAGWNTRAPCRGLTTAGGGGAPAAASSPDAMTSTSGKPVAPAGGRSVRSGVGPAASGSSRSGDPALPAGPRANTTTLRPAPAFSAAAAAANSARAGTTSRACRALDHASWVVTSAVPLSTARRIG
jgi:hypothetical protein